MSFTMEIYELLKRYTKDSEDIDISIMELQQIEWWRCVWGSWRAEAYYQTGKCYERLEDVPAGLTNFIIQTDMVRDHYMEGYVQTITKDLCKKYYGK